MNFNSARWRAYGVSGIGAILFTIIFWIAYGCEWKHMYSPYPYHRLEALAMLHGHFALGHSIRNIDWDLAWHDGQVNHVWGLGVGIWMLPFEAIYRLGGGSDLPDRIPLLAAVALFAFYVWQTALLIVRKLHSWPTGVMFAWLALAVPPFWNLVLGYKLVYEDTVLYAVILGLTLVTGTIRCFLQRQSLDFFIVCLLAALSSLVRPTFGVYGLLAVFFSSLALLQAPRNAFNRHYRLYLIIAGGWTITLAGFVFLLYSNWVRFGSPWEFGHNLTISGDMIVYATRFDNPYAGVKLVPAVKELFSWIFLSPFFKGGSWCSPHAIPWQADTARWREIYQPTFDPSWLLILLVAFGMAFQFLRRRIDKTGWKVLLNDKPIQRLVIMLLLWVVMACLPLSFFYLRFPTLSTRYILDYTPAFFPILMVIVLLAVRRFPKTTMAAAIVWLLGQHIMLSSNLIPVTMLRQHPVSFDDRPELPSPAGKEMSDYHGQYTIKQHPEGTGIFCNGYCWFRSGLSKSVITVMVDRPQFLEICLADHLEGTNRPAATGVYRAKIDNTELPVQSLRHEVVGTNSAVRIRFTIPEKIRRQNDDQLVSLCFTKSMDLVDLTARRYLFEIKWR